jgi:hypothetical protein
VITYGEVDEMRAVAWRPYQKGSLQGFFTLVLDSGMEIEGCGYHTKNGKSWVSFPGKSYTNEQGETKYQSIIRIPDERRWRQFQELAKKAVTEAMQGQEGDYEPSF